MSRSSGIQKTDIGLDNVSIIPAFGLHGVSLRRPMSSFLGIGCPDSYDTSATATPDYDSVGPDCFWSCNDWIDWHKNLVAAYGKDVADATWVGAYDQSGILSHELNCATGTGDFVTYVKAQGLAAKSNLLSRMYNIQGVIDSTTAPIKNTLNAAANLTKTAADITKWLPYVLIGAGILVVGIVIFKFYNGQKITPSI